MNRVVITGATSFIGLNLIDELLKKNYYIIAIVRQNSNKINKLPKSDRIKIIELNMDSINTLHEKIHAKVDVFIHLAWDGTRGETRDDESLQQRNYQFSMDAINEAYKLGCKMFVGAGSQAEYGLYNDKSSETTKCMPVTEYGKAKLRLCDDGYKLCQKYKISFKWPRFFSLYGIDDYEGTLLISLIDNMLNNKEISLTACTQKWNFLYIKDAVKAVLKLIEHKCPDGIYNIGSEDTRQLRSFIEEIGAIINPNSVIGYGQIPYPSADIANLHPSIEKISQETDWKPETLFKTGIKKVILSRRKK